MNNLFLVWIPETHNKEHIVEPVENEPTPITSSAFEEPPKEVEPAASVREPSPGNF